MSNCARSFSLPSDWSPRSAERWWIKNGLDLIRFKQLHSGNHHGVCGDFKFGDQLNKLNTVCDKATETSTFGEPKLEYQTELDDDEETLRVDEFRKLQQRWKI